MKKRLDNNARWIKDATGSQLVDEINERCGKLLSSFKNCEIVISDIEKFHGPIEVTVNGLIVTLPKDLVTYIISCTFQDNGLEIRKKLRKASLEDKNYKASCAWMSGDQRGVIIIAEKQAFEKRPKLKTINDKIGLFEQ